MFCPFYILEKRFKETSLLFLKQLEVKFKYQRKEKHQILWIFAPKYYRKCREIAKNLKSGEKSSTNCLENISSKQKRFDIKIIVSSITPMLSIKLFIMGTKDCVNLNILVVTLFTICQTPQCIALAVQCFYLRKNKGSLVHLSTRDKRVAIPFYQNQRLSLGNQ